MDALLPVHSDAINVQRSDVYEKSMLCDLVDELNYPSLPATDTPL